MSVAQIREQTPAASEIRMRKEPFSGPIAWTKDSLAPDDGLIRVGPSTLAELNAMVATMRANPLPMELLTPDQFDLSSWQEVMRRAKHMLDNGVGFVIIDRLPTVNYSVDENKAIYWVLMQLLERPVAQDWKGGMVYNVRDSGKPLGNGVRAVLTNVEQHFHTDNNFNICPPEYVALLCLQTAMEGGINSIVSAYTVYNEMLRRHLDLVPRLYQPYLFDRQREHAEGEPMVYSHPVYKYDGARLVCRFSHVYITNGYKLVGQELDPIGERALGALESIMCEPLFKKEFFFEPGQIQIIDNTRCGHRRTAFRDYAEPERKRHLLRLWLRGQGRRFYNG